MDEFEFENEQAELEYFFNKGKDHINNRYTKLFVKRAVMRVFNASEQKVLEIHKKWVLNDGKE